MRSFREVLECCHLYDLGCKENWFTWCNRHGDETFIKERLDRMVTNSGWKNMFKVAETISLLARCSDHRPIILSMQAREFYGRKRRYLFHFEATWPIQEECGNIVKYSWAKHKSGTTPMSYVMKNLKECGGALAEMAKQDSDSLNEKTTQLQKLQEVEGPQNTIKIRELQKKRKDA